MHGGSTQCSWGTSRSFYYNLKSIFHSWAFDSPIMETRANEHNRRLTGLLYTLIPGLLLSRQNWTCHLSQSNSWNQFRSPNWLGTMKSENENHTPPIPSWCWKSTIHCKSGDDRTRMRWTDPWKTKDQWLPPGRMHPCLVLSEARQQHAWGEDEPGLGLTHGAVSLPAGFQDFITWESRGSGPLQAARIGGQSADPVQLHQRRGLNCESPIFRLSSTHTGASSGGQGTSGLSSPWGTSQSHSRLCPGVFSLYSWCYHLPG